jgi:hypothetical protein
MRYNRRLMSNQLLLSGRQNDKAVAVFSGGNLSPGVREDRANRWVIVAFGLIGLLDAYLPAYTDQREFWTFDLGLLVNSLG